MWIFSRQPILSSTATKIDECARQPRLQAPATGYLTFAQRARPIVKTMEQIARRQRLARRVGRGRPLLRFRLELQFLDDLLAISYECAALLGIPDAREVHDALAIGEDQRVGEIRRLGLWILCEHAIGLRDRRRGEEIQVRLAPNLHGRRDQRRRHARVVIGRAFERWLPTGVALRERIADRDCPDDADIRLGLRHHALIGQV